MLKDNGKDKIEIQSLKFKNRLRGAIFKFLRGCRQTLYNALSNTKTTAKTVKLIANTFIKLVPILLGSINITKIYK